MSLLPGGKLRSYKNGQPIYAADWMAEFNHLLKAYNVGQIDWQGANFWAGVPVACQPSQMFFAPPTDLQDYSFNIDYIYVNLGTTTNTCTGMTMLINGNPVGDIQSPDGTTPTIGETDTCTVTTNVSDDGCVSQFLVINAVVTTYYVINQLQYVPVLGDTVTFTPGYTFATGGCNPVGGTGCPSVFTLFINGASSGASVCIPPGQTTGTTTTDIPLALGDQITIVPEGPPGGGDATAGIGGHAIPGVLNLVQSPPVLTRFYVDDYDGAATPALVLTAPVTGHYIKSTEPGPGTDLAITKAAYQLSSDTVFTGHPDNTFQLRVFGSKSGYETNGAPPALANLSAAQIKIDLLIVASDAVDKLNPTGGEILATLVSTASNITGNLGWGDVSADNQDITYLVFDKIGGPILEPTLAPAGSYLVLRMFTDVDGVAPASNVFVHGAFDDNTFSDGQLVQFVTGGNFVNGGTQLFIEIGTIGL